jgi:hypothetical protein
MVQQPKQLQYPFDKLLQKRLREAKPDFRRLRYKIGLKCLSADFFSLLNLSFLQYLLLLQNFSGSKLKGTSIVTHGYDYLIPRKRAPWWKLPCWVKEWWTDSGNCLWLPMEERKLADVEKRAAAYAIVTEFNQTLTDLANFTKNAGFHRFFHVDCRGLATKRDWYDEIHLTSEGFRKVKDLMDKCMGQAKAAGQNPQQIFTKNDLPPGRLDGTEMLGNC